MGNFMRHPGLSRWWRWASQAWARVRAGNEGHCGGQDGANPQSAVCGGDKLEPQRDVCSGEAGGEGAPAGRWRREGQKGLRGSGASRRKTSGRVVPWLGSAEATKRTPAGTGRGCCWPISAKNRCRDGRGETAEPMRLQGLGSKVRPSSRSLLRSSRNQVGKETLSLTLPARLGLEQPQRGCGR